MSDKIKTTEEEFDEIEELFPGEEDKEIIRTNRAIYKESKDLYALSSSPGGRSLIASLKAEITDDIKKLIDTREGRYLSDLNSHLTLLTKLTDAKTQTEAISSWLESINK